MAKVGLTKSFLEIQGMSPVDIPSKVVDNLLEHSIAFMMKRDEMQQQIIKKAPFDSWSKDPVLANGLIEHPIFTRQLYTRFLLDRKYKRLMNDPEKLFLNILLTRITNYPSKIVDETIPIIDTDFDPKWLHSLLEKNRPCIASFIYQLSPNLPHNWGYKTQTETGSYIIKKMWKRGLEAVTSPGTPLERTMRLNKEFRGNAVFLSHQITWDYNLMYPSSGFDEYSDESHVGIGAKWWVETLRAKNRYKRKVWEMALNKYWPHGPHDEIMKSITLRDHCGCACRIYFKFKYDGIPNGRRLQPNAFQWA